MLVSVDNTPVLNKVSDVIYEDTTSGISRLVTPQAGEVWHIEQILNHKTDLFYSGRTWSIVDNLVVHDEIKYGGLESSYYIENYKLSLINLAKAGIRVVCYNFMPIFYKVRTHFYSSFSDPYAFSMFDPVAFAVFDMFILKRQGAEKSYTEYQRHAARLFEARLTHYELQQLESNVLRSVQGTTNPSLDFVRGQLEHYGTIESSELKLAHSLFKAQVEPLAKALGLTLYFNTDNPAGNLMNLPGI